MLTNQIYDMEKRRLPAQKPIMNITRRVIDESQDTFTNKEKDYVCHYVIKESNFYGLHQIRKKL